MKLAWALLGCIILPVQVRPATGEMPFSAGILCNREKNHKVSAAHEDELVRRLRRITGLKKLSFAADGSLLPGNLAESEAGSSVARQIIFCALGSGKTFIIDDYAGSPSVLFGQIDEGTDFEDIRTKERREIWRLRIDFDDFHEIDAPSEVRESFDVGFTVLHELLHGLGYKDATSINELGSLEGLVNQARAELGLPQRDLYFGEPIQISPQISTVRLRFRKGRRPSLDGQEKQNRQRLDYLYFLLPADYRGLERRNGMILLNFMPRE